MIRISTLSLLLILPSAIWTQNVPRTTAPARSIELPSKHSAVPPIGEFEDRTESPQLREHRSAREKHIGPLNPLSPEPLSDPGLVVGGKTEHAAMVFIDTVQVRIPGTEGLTPELRGIPAWGSSAIVIGTILSGRSFVTGDRSGVYTDYQIRLDQILKPDKGATLAVGQQLLASRRGGAVHFPSGHITDFYIAGQGMPKIGSQYILFLLRPSPDLPEYKIAADSGYELADGRVYPLDDVNQEYEGMAQSAFLGLVRDAISSAKGGSRP